jgi:hypothetical protein
MTKKVLILFFICSSVLAFAQEAPKKVAVYAFGACDAGINKSLGSKLLAELAQSGKYAEISDHYSFQDELSGSGNNGIGNITQAAMRHGADFVCAVSIAEAFGAYSITARMVNTSDSKVVRTASLDRSLKSLDDLAQASRELAGQLLGKPPILAPSLAPVAAVAGMSLAQALGSSSLAKGCVDDFTNVLGKSGFSMASFAKELPAAVAKTKVQLKAPFGKPKDSDMTSAGLSVGCIKTLPESPAEIMSLLKDISLKAGLDFAADAAAGLAKSAADDDGDEEEKDKSTVSFGIRAGMNFSHYYAEYKYYGYSGSRSGNGSYKSTMGFQAGMVLDIAVSDWFHLQPGVMYIQKGAEDKDGGAITSHNIEFPLLLSLKLSVLRLNAGPYYGIYVNSNYYDLSNDFGISTGMGFDIGMFYIGGFYDYGLTDISSGSSTSLYNRTLGFNLGVNL